MKINCSCICQRRDSPAVPIHGAKPVDDGVSNAGHGRLRHAEDGVVRQLPRVALAELVSEGLHDQVADDPVAHGDGQVDGDGDGAR